MMSIHYSRECQLRSSTLSDLILIHPTRAMQRLTFREVPFTLVEAESVCVCVCDFMQRQHPCAVRTVIFHDCLFLLPMDILWFSSSRTALQLAAIDGLQTIQVKILKQDLCAAWFPWLTDFATELSISGCWLGDASFKIVVNVILGGNAKNNLKRLSADSYRITADGLVDATCLVEQSQLEWLIMNNNHGMLDNLRSSETIVQQTQEQ